MTNYDGYLKEKKLKISTFRLNVAWKIVNPLLVGNWVNALGEAFGGLTEARILT